MLSDYTARFVKIRRGYMGQLVEWPEVVTEGKNLEECRLLLKDAMREMIKAYELLGKDVPVGMCTAQLVGSIREKRASHE